ncbi:MAG: glycosyltransferase family 9 protein [Cyanobacteria bacterium P01_G01_bin.54]
MRINGLNLLRRLRLIQSWPGRAILTLILLLWRWGVKGHKPEIPQRIFILRNNDLGDLLIITPLFAALKQRYPQAEIWVGVGHWNVPTLEQNPFVDRILPINAPWHNKGVSQQSLWRRWRYLLTSPELFALRDFKADVGIDIFGSPWGAMLLLRAGIPYRLGVRGYAGGAIAAHDWIDYDPQLQVGRSALRFATLLGATALPAARPQLFLTVPEQAAAEQRWRRIASDRHRMIIGPGSGLDERYWPLASYQVLAAELANWQTVSVVLVGGGGDRAAAVEMMQGAGAQPNLWDWTGQLSLRQTFALVATADLVISNSSMLMHAAAAFNVETLVLLGGAFASRKQHDCQWGYDAHYWSLGKEPGEQLNIASPAAAIAQVKCLLQSQPES